MKPFTTIAAIIFAVMMLAHVWRLATGFDVIVAGTAIPMWVSIPAVLVTGLLALMLWRERRV